jgi:UDP-glucose 4-epimerase
MEATQYTVLGASGFIGRRLVAALCTSGASCYAPQREETAALFERELGSVFYCIGLTADYASRPFDTIEAHVGLLSAILSRASFKRLIYLSSTRLYDGLGAAICGEDADLVLNPANPRHSYDFSKALGENLCLTASGGRAKVARLSSVYDDAPDAAGFLPSLLRRLARERKFVIDSASGIVRDYVYVGDVVNGLIKFSSEQVGEIVNIASGENISNGEIVDILNAQGYQIQLQRQSKRETRPVCDVAKLRALGVAPLSLRLYLQRVVTFRAEPR